MLSGFRLVHSDQSEKKVAKKSNQSHFCTDAVDVLDVTDYNYQVLYNFWLLSARGFCFPWPDLIPVVAGKN